jgi:hypothetical protein
MHGRTGRPAGSGRPEPVSRCMLIAGRAGTVCGFSGVACGVRDDRRGLRRSCWPAGGARARPTQKMWSFFCLVGPLGRPRQQDKLHGLTHQPLKEDQPVVLLLAKTPRSGKITIMEKMSEMHLESLNLPKRCNLVLKIRNTSF